MLVERMRRRTPSRHIRSRAAGPTCARVASRRRRGWLANHPGVPVNRPTVLRRASALLVPLLIAMGVFAAAPAGASVPLGEPLDPPPFEPGQFSSTTEATVVDLINTSALYGGEVPTATATTPYPSGGLQNQRSVTTAQILLDDPTGSGDIVTYCIDLDTETTRGVHYELGDWTAANVPNLPYVQWILENYYPQVPAAPVAGTDAEKVRAVQGAIWYFTDQFVVSRFYPEERAAVRLIVEAAQAAVDPTPTPPPAPVLEVAPASATAPAGTVTGPYTVEEAGVDAAAIRFFPQTQVFRDQAATQPVASGAAVADGDVFWVRFEEGAVDPGFVIEGTATAAAGNVYLYDGNNPPRTSAQKLILAEQTTVPVRAALAITPEGRGNLDVVLSIGGAAAGDQGRITMEVTCIVPGSGYGREIYVRGGLPAGSVTVARYTGIPAGASCDIVQVAAGDTAFAVLTSTTSPVQGVPIVAGETATATIANVYAHPSPRATLAVDVQISGPAAGAQGALQLLATCTTDGGAVAPGDISRTIDVPAALTGTTQVATIDALPPGASCTIAQTVDGRTDAAVFDAAASGISPDPAVLVAGTTTRVLVRDVYRDPSRPTGSLAVDATVSGTAAGAQGALALTVVCTLDGETRSIPVGADAGITGTTRVATIDDIDVDAECALSQSADGADADALLTSTVVSAPVTVREGAPVVLSVTNVYAAPAPTPTPQPTPSVLPATGGEANASGWGLGLLSVGVGGLLVSGAAFVRSRRSASGA
jgi:TQXA domain-containing protein